MQKGLEQLMLSVRHLTLHKGKNGIILLICYVVSVEFQGQEFMLATILLLILDEIYGVKNILVHPSFKL